VPKVSVILPTFNRADTIMRAIRSAQAQTFQDWELIIVDDGSTDDTAGLIGGADPRVRLIRQENRGFTEARNAGIGAARGDYIAFLDSDDEFLPHHLELCVAFLEANRDEPFVSTEVLENFGLGRTVNHYRIETSTWYPQKAALIGSHSLDLPPGETDNYLRVYDSREAIGEWGRAIVERAGDPKRAFLYRGNISEYMRYDFLITITGTVFRSTIFEVTGLPDPRWATGSDFHYLASLCRRFKATFISVPTYTKHEYASDGALPSFGHVVTGRSAMRFALEWQRAWDDLFWSEGCQDLELRRLRSLRLFWIAQVALKAGQREAALSYLKSAKEHWPRFGRANALFWLVQCLPGTEPALKILWFAGKIQSRLNRGPAT
jgi:glycosyltransferase involved in cell wall biosynthesis